MQEGIKLSGLINIKVYDGAGNLIADYSKKNEVKTAGLYHVADQMSDQGEAAMSHMAIGTGTGGTTALNTEVSRNALTSKSQGSGGDANKVTYIASFTGVTGTIKEAGILNAASGGTLFVYNDSLSQALSSSDTLQITWTVTFSAS